MPSYGGTVKVPIVPVSDGDPTHAPSGANYQIFDPPTIYLEKLADLWMKERGEFVPGVSYVLDKLPHGYTVWGRPRKNNPEHIDKWAYGHPEGKTFDSPNRFFPHFLHLMNNDGSNFGCPCAVCTSGGGGTMTKARPTTTSVAKSGTAKHTPIMSTQPTLHKFKGKPRQVETSSQRTDEEGTPDIYRNLIDKLHRHGRIYEAIRETMSLDWRAERKLLPPLLNQLMQQGQWLPRPGEIVLFVRNLSPGATEIGYDSMTGQYKVWSNTTSRFGDVPRWEAGVVTQPAVEAPCVEDLVAETDKHYQRNYSGFRIEPLPDPNSTAKHWSKQHKYLPLNSMRPFAFWSEFLQGISDNEWHPTIKHAFTVMSTFSLVEKQLFTGLWPAASISCRGIYIGSELILVGDTVRLMPKREGSAVTDILKITSIKLILLNLDTASDDDYDNKHPYNTAVHITGQALTSDPQQAATKIPLTDVERSSFPIDGYNEEWFWIHEPGKGLRIPFNRILGRLFEADAMAHWFPSAHNVDPGQELTRGVEGMYQARHYSSTNYGKIEKGKSWFWGDSRVEALDLSTINGQEVGSHDKTRDPKTWRKLIKIMEGNAGLEDKLALKKAANAERPLRQGSTQVTSSWRAVNMPEERGTGVEALPGARKRTYSLLERNAGAGVDVDMDMDRATDEDEADQFIDELAGNVGLAQSDEELAQSDDDVVMLDSVPTQTKKQKRLELRGD